MINEILELLNAIEKTLKQEYNIDASVLLSIGTSDELHFDIINYWRSNTTISKEAVSYIVSEINNSKITNSYDFRIIFESLTFDNVYCIDKSNIDKYV